MHTGKNDIQLLGTLNDIFAFITYNVQRSWALFLPMDAVICAESMELIRHIGKILDNLYNVQTASKRETIFRHNY